MHTFLLNQGLQSMLTQYIHLSKHAGSGHFHLTVLCLRWVLLQLPTFHSENKHIQQTRCLIFYNISELETNLSSWADLTCLI